MAEYTDEQLAELLQKTGDKRVTEALATAKAKWKAEQDVLLESEREKVKIEIENNAKLTAEELAQKNLADKLAEITARETELAMRKNDITAKELLTEANVPKERYEKLLGILVTNDEETTKTNVAGLIDMYKATVTQIESDVKSQYSKINPPPTGGNGEITKEQFSKMTYGQKLEFKDSNPELFNQYMN